LPGFTRGAYCAPAILRQPPIDAWALILTARNKRAMTPQCAGLKRPHWLRFCKRQARKC
jgi:hypothetical protein